MLSTAAVSPDGPIYAAGAGRFDSVEVNLAPGDDLFAGLRWRNIGPFHGGRIAAVTGAIGQPGVFYIGAPAGGIWKTTSAGVTWFPIFDQFTNVDSIGAIQVAPSDSNIVYAGTGDSVQGSLGDGMYKSIDAGKTWTHLGLEDTVKINRISIDPKDPDLVLVSTQGDARHSGRGIYRSTDGGKTWVNVLKPENANGTRDLEYAFDMPHVMFATSQSLFGGGFGGGGGGGAAPQGPNGTQLFKSTDAGKTWKKVDTLPPYTGRISVAIAMHTKGQRVFVVGGLLQGGSGLYRSDDQGATWQHMGGDDTRVANGQGAFSSGVWVDSQNPDILYTISTTVYRSTDGGRTFSAFKGAPGGEDPHDLWIDPTNGQRMLFGFDQGPAVTLDGGQTWSGYYQIPIAQIYHISTDTRYPYWVMGSQQDTGAIMTRSRSDQGQITVVDWLPLPSSEFGTLAPDPLKPTTVYGVGYGAGQGNGLIKIDLATGQWGNVAPNFGADSGLYVAGRDFWKRFDTAFEPKALYVGYNCILVTRDGAQTWKAFSPDLTKPKGEPMAPCGVAPAPGTTGGRGANAAAPPAGTTPAATPPPATPTTPTNPVAGLPASARFISDFAISTVKKGVVWTGSSTGQVYRTVDGGVTWTNVTNFPDLPAGAIAIGQIVTVEAGHSDVDTAYVLVNGGGGGSGTQAPEQHHIYRTHDGGKTWTRIVNGLPVDERTGSRLNVIREDPKQKGLLFAGTETTVYVSFDDGDHWQSLRLNLPSTSIRDMVFHTADHINDLVIGTYGRGFWVLDDMSPLRDIAAKAQQIAAAPAYLFKPGDAIRSRMNSNWDQPMNPEMPHAPNPPFGALLYYHLSQKPAGEIKLQIFDSANKLVRTITKAPPPPVVGRIPYPDYWLMPSSERALSTNVGTNRINWDLRYDDPPGYNPDINNQMNSAPGTVTPGPHGPLALPGTYTVKLLVDGATYTQTLVVHNDPRIGEGANVMSALRTQNKLAMAAGQGMKDSYAANQEVAAVRAQLAAMARGSLPPDVATVLTALDAKLATIGGVRPSGRGGGGGFGGGAGAARAPGSVIPFFAVNALFNTVLAPLAQNGLDMPPTKSEVDTWESGCKEFTATANAWKTMLGVDLIGFSSQLTKNNLTPLKITPTALAVPASCTFVWPAAPARGGK
ncbi:MAG TPA: glycoside hydrolase [Casimicrobiaceae bacterium]|nr:glycoside hydrolase [Casimicrobiaceae bacterium]